jgi:phosphatidylserine/phosphatidylglycerophosphate/cardiolipin synthase-like enzyme
LDYYENAVEALRNRGVQVVIILPSFAETSYKMIEERLALLFAEFEKRGLNFAIPPQESAYPDSLFFDTYYHLGYEGVLIRTNQLIKVMN